MSYGGSMKSSEGPKKKRAIDVVTRAPKVRYRFSSKFLLKIPTMGPNTTYESVPNRKK